MEQNAASAEALRRATRHLQQLLLHTTPGKSPSTAAGEAEAIANLAFVPGNPVRQLFLAATPRAELDRPRSPSPAGTIRPKSSKAFFKFGRGSRDKSGAASGSSSSAKPGQVDGVSPLFEQVFGPIGTVEDKKSKRKERVLNDGPTQASSAGASRGVPVTSFCSSQQKPARVYEQYRCIVCDAELSSKGVCKRHLEDQHITPKVYECEGCHAYFDAKADAKKHCSQCGGGHVSWFATKLAKKVYACEYTGNWFTGHASYTETLLKLSEQKVARPKPCLNTKLDAILRHAESRNPTPTVIHIRDRICENLFGWREAWKSLQWDQDYLRTKIIVLEHATFNPDGTLESTRWTGSSPKRRNTETYLTQLFQKASPPPNSRYAAPTKPEPMSICPTPMPVAHTAQSVTSGPSSAGTPLSATSPMPRSQSRQTIWSHDSMDQSTTASTPRSGDDVMTAELKTKRHLSDESRAYIPARTPPGPPELSDHYQYSADPNMMGTAAQLPALPAFMAPSNSTISLPLRKQQPHTLPETQTMVSAPHYHHALYQMHPSSSSHTLPSDVASETSTLAQSYREPELADTISLDDYNLWAQQQQQQQHLGFPSAGHPPVYGYAHYPDYSMPDDASSMVASSINTGHTIGVEYVSELPKMESYSDMDLATGHVPPHGGTFYLPDAGEEGREVAMR